MKRMILFLLIVFVQTNLFAGNHKLGSYSFKPDSISASEISFLYEGEQLTANLLRILAPRQTQLLLIQIEMEIPKTLADSLPNLVVLPESIKVYFAKNDETPPYGSCTYSDVVVLMLLQWSFPSPVTKGNVIGFIVRYHYMLDDKVVGSGDLNKYIYF